MEKSGSSHSAPRKRESLTAFKNSSLYKSLSKNSLNVSTLNKLENSINHNSKNNLSTDELYQYRNINNLENEYKEFLENFKNATSLRFFAKKLLNLKHLKNIDSVVIYYHLKGQSHAQGIHYESQDSYENLKCEVSNFSSLYNQVKKSKNKIFNNSSEFNEILPVIGTYLADTLRTKFYDLIIVITRNDFLPPTSSEIEELAKITYASEPFLSSILELKSAESRFEIIESALEKSKIPFRLLSSDKEIYKSKSFHNFDDSNFLRLENKDLKLQVHDVNKSKHESEIFHFQRVAILGELLNTLQHELSNPLFGIRLSSEILLLEQEDQETKDFMQQVLDSSLRCQNIIKDFSTLYTIGEDKEDIDLSKVIKESLTLSKSATQNIEKEIHIDPEINSTRIYSNPRWINHIIFNAIINSAQALNSQPENEKKKISIAVEKNLTDISIKIRDNGPGLANSTNNDEVFSAFYTTKKDGTGLGLSICKNLARKLDAEIHLQNNQNNGCTFTMFIKYEENTIN